MTRTKIYKSAQKTAEAFGDYLMAQIHTKDAYHCALSGGSTPKLLFDYLAKEYADSPSWNNVHFYWGDERCVPPEDEESNYKMTKERLLDKVPIPEQNVHRVLGEADPKKEAARYGSELTAHIPVQNGLPVFDLIILGMGGDGHTASIFPHQMELLTTKSICAVAQHPESGQHRVTLTGPVINAAREVAFLVTGQGKSEKVTEILNHSGNWKDYPAAHIELENGKVIWYLDEAAARPS